MQVSRSGGANNCWTACPQATQRGRGRNSYRVGGRGHADGYPPIIKVHLVYNSKATFPPNPPGVIRRPTERMILQFQTPPKRLSVGAATCVAALGIYREFIKSITVAEDRQVFFRRSWQRQCCCQREKRRAAKRANFAAKATAVRPKNLLRFVQL